MPRSTRRMVLLGGATALAVAGRSAAAAARLVADPRVDAEFLRRFPAAARIDGSGRGWRLADAAITPEAFGARGDGIANDQPAIQQAVRFAEAVGAPEVRFAAARYALWTPRRTSPVTSAGVHHPDGHALVVTGRLTLRGARGGTTLSYRSPDGRSLQDHWQIVDGVLWRGAGIWLKGLDAVPADPALRPGVTLIGMTLDGGCDQGRYFGNPARLSDGDGWDLTHKGLWSENDRVTGDWVLHDSEVRRFRGELFYQGGADHGAFIGRNIRMGQTNGDILNPCGTNIDIDGGYFHDGYSGWEGWGGRNGRLVRCRFVRCHSLGGLQGGRCNFTPGANYEEPRRAQPGVDPWVTLDVVAEDCGAVAVGCWVRGRIVLIDSFLYLSNVIYPSLHTIDLSVTAIADRKTDLGPAVAIHGGGKRGQRSLSDVRIALDVGATADARAAGRMYRQPADWGGSIGAGVVVRLGRTTTQRASGPSFATLDATPAIVTG